MEALFARVQLARPRLHRYCARMTGSQLDGEDVVQETILQAHASLATLADGDRLEPWLFRIAHHKCIDFLRREERHRDSTVSLSEQHDAPQTGDNEYAATEAIDAGLATLVYALPPKERAAVLLKDVLEYDLAETAEIIDSTLGGVKAALHRARTKLRELRNEPSNSRDARAPRDGQLLALFKSYAECFNRRDWDALRALIRTDATFQLVGVLDGTMDGAGRHYYSNYVSLPYDWRLSLATLDGELTLIHEKCENNQWVPFTAVRLTWNDNKVIALRDYVHVEYLFTDLTQGELIPIPYTA